MEGRSLRTGKHASNLHEVRLDPWPLLGNKRGEQTLLVEPEHQAELRAFVEYARRSAKAFWALLVASLVLCLGGTLLSLAWAPAIWAVPAGLLLLTWMLVAYAFATPETIRAMGIRRSVILARVGAGVMFALAVATVLIALRAD